jgi:pimeloyl-ACP methyl ester carboxylesterase
MPESLTPHSSPLTLHSSEAVILVHGLFRNGWEMALLRLRLAAVGYRVVQFTYPTVRLSPEKNAKDLQAFIDKKIEAETLHFVAHSLGGLVIRYLFHDFPKQRPGRIVTMGTPHQGSSAAAGLAHTLSGRLLLGESFKHGLSGDVPPWTHGHEIGVIAGSAGIGMGLLVTHLSHPNDGTVAVVETHLPNATDHITIPVSHVGMLLSDEVTYQTRCFLRHGSFDPRARGHVRLRGHGG